ncbi:MAG: GldM family protein, partial [Bacteroidota bacterium]
INDSMEITNANFEANNAHTYQQFDKAKLNDPVKAMKWWQRAQDVKALADELDAYIDELKREVVKATDGLTEASPDSAYILKNVNSKDNYDIPTQVMIGSEPATPKDGPWTALELGKKLRDYEANLKDKLGPELVDEVNLGLEQKKIRQPDGKMETWENGNFFHIPLAAVVTNLTKIQADVRNAEAEVIKALLSNISATDFKFDTLAAKVIPNTNYLILGDTFRADVFVAAFSSTQDPKMAVTTGWDTTKTESDLDSSGITFDRGVAKWKFAPKAEGLVEWGGVIKVKKPDNTFAAYPFNSAFMVAKPTLVVSPTAMNVFYRGLGNPVEVSVPGVPTEKLEISITNLVSKSGSKGKLEVKPGKGKECVVSVSAEINGKKQSFGKQTFRVKNVPDPKPYFAGVSAQGNVPLKKLKAARGVLAKMENFEFDLKFNVVSFTMSATVKGKVVDQKSRGAAVTSDMKKLIAALRPGQKLYIERIKAKGPDGTVRDLGTIVLKAV